MHTAELIELSRDVDASIVPSGDKVTNKAPRTVSITNLVLYSSDTNQMSWHATKLMQGIPVVH